MTSIEQVDAAARDEAFLNQIRQYGRLVFSSVGDSMFPMLRSGRDIAVLTARPERLKRGDVALYRSEAGAYVLHRVIALTEDGYLFRGDNCPWFDAPVPEANVLAVVSGWYRGKLFFSVHRPLYRLYAAVWRSDSALRRCLLHFLRGLRRKKAKLTRGGKGNAQE